MDEALGFLVEEGLVEVRLGAGGRIKQPAAGLIVGRFSHYNLPGGGSERPHPLYNHERRGQQRRKIANIKRHTIYTQNAISSA